MKVRIPNQGPSRNDMLKQVQKMQEDMANLQADLDEREYTATSGGGMISVTVNGKHEIKELMGGMGINSIESLKGNRLMLRGVGLTDRELDILGIFHAGE